MVVNNLRDIGPHFDQRTPPIQHHALVGRIEAQRDRHDRRPYQRRQAGREVRRQDQCVEAVVGQQAEDALRAGHLEVVLVRGPKLGAGVVEAERERLVPHGRVAVRVVFRGEGVGEVSHVGEVVHVVRVEREHREVLAGEVGDEVGVQDDAFVGAVVVLGEGIGGDVGVVDDCSAGLFDGLNGGVEGGDDGVVGLLGRVDHVAWDADALSAQTGEVAGGDVIGRRVERLGQGVVVPWVLAGNGLEDVRCVFDRPRYGAYGVLALTDGDDEGS